MKKSKLFISHASADIQYVEPLVELLADIGLNSETMFCSSIPDYHIPMDNDIYEYLKNLFNEYDLHVIFVLSDNYYKSAACLNEMGAAWVLQKKYSTILLPDFNYSEIIGAVNPRKIALKLGKCDDEAKTRLKELKRIIEEEFNLSVPDNRWEKKRDTFIQQIDKICSENPKSKKESDSAVYFRTLNSQFSTLIQRMLWFEERIINNDYEVFKWPPVFYSSLNFILTYSSKYEKDTISFEEAEQRILNMKDKYAYNNFSKLSKVECEKAIKMFQALNYYKDVFILSEINKIEKDKLLLNTEKIISLEENKKLVEDYGIIGLILNNPKGNYGLAIELIFSIAKKLRELTGYNEDISIDISGQALAT